jgi:hypothetical protein
MEKITLTKVDLRLNNEKEFNEIQIWFNNFLEKYNNLSDKINKDTDIEKIKENIIERYKYCEKIKDHVLSNDVLIAKNNILSLMYKNLRKESIKYNIEKEISKLITDNNIFLICNILKKHNMDYYDYIDKIAILENMYMEIGEKLETLNDDIKMFFYTIIEALHYKFLFSDDNLTMMKELLFDKKLLTNMKNQKKKKYMNHNFISLCQKYLNQMEISFDESFRNDYDQLTISFMEQNAN